MIAVPLSGWLRTSAGTYELTWFGLVDVPKFAIAPGTRGAALAAHGHEALAWLMAALVVAHCVAALHHQFCLRDALLSRMVPRLWA